MSDVKIAYGASFALTCDLGGLVTSSTLIGGRASTSVDNTSTKYTDFLLSGYITVNASVAPTANTMIEVWAYGSINDTPLFPDGITGTDAAFSVTSVNMKFASLRLAYSVTVTAVANIDYWIAPVSLASLFGGVLPKHVGVWVTHNTAQALAASGAHALYLTPVYATVT